MSHARRAPRRLSARSAADRAFDDLVPDELRHLSEMHWTPIEVGVRMARLLSLREGERVLDIGAGIGKLCSVGALSSRASWYGVEQYQPLVTVAERLARTLGIADRTTFFVGDAFSVDWNGFDVLYFYNPFELPLFPTEPEAGSNRATFRAQVARAEERLNALPIGTRVVTFHGYGGTIPPGFDLLFSERVRTMGLRLNGWIRRADGARDANTSTGE